MDKQKVASIVESWSAQKIIEEVSTAGEGYSLCILWFVKDLRRRMLQKALEAKAFCGSLFNLSEVGGSAKKLPLLFVDASNDERQAVLTMSE